MSESNCPNCGFANETGSAYCERCGAPLHSDLAGEPVGGMPEQEVEVILQTRKEKDYFFKHHPQSPIPQEMRQTFEGLHYFPVNSAYRFLCKLNRHPNPTPVRMMTSTGEQRDYLKVGVIQFIVDGKTQTLEAFKATQEHEHEGERESLFIPFKDATSGKESYGAARYLEIESVEDDLFLVDFNKAYNPYCAYSENYNCPYPPTENWLHVEIRAGEQKFKD